MPSWAGNIVTAMVKMADAYLASINKKDLPDTCMEEENLLQKTKYNFQHMSVLYNEVCTYQNYSVEVHNHATPCKPWARCAKQGSLCDPLLSNTTRSFSSLKNSSSIFLRK
jgi:hypothetical protein